MSTKIVVDTKTDSVDDVKDTIKMLQALIESRSGTPTSNFYSANPSSSGSDGGIMGMFGDASPSTPQSTLPQPSTAPPGTDALVSLFNDNDETLKDDTQKDDVPKIEIIDY